MSGCGVGGGSLAVLPHSYDKLMTPLLCAARARPTAMYVTLAIAAALVIVSVETAAQTRPDASSTLPVPSRVPRPLGCDTTWTPLRELKTRLGQPAYVEAPITVSNTAGTFLIGSPTFVWEDSTAFITEKSTREVGAVGVKLLKDGTAMPLPPLPSATKPYRPIAVARGAKLLVVWGTSADTSAAGVWHQDTLWEATLDAGRWSAPRPIQTAREFVWHPGASSYIADDSSLVLAFPSAATNPPVRRGVTIMSRSQRTWHARWIDVGSLGPSGVALMRTAPTELLVAAAGSIARDGFEAPNAVYAMRVSLRDTTSVPRFSVIRDMKNLYAEDLSVFRTPAGLHIAWRQPGRRVFADDSLVEATSRDDGRSWSVTTAISLDGDTRGLRVVPLADGNVEAMALDLGGWKILTLGRTMGRWALKREAFPDARTSPMIAATRDRMSVSFAQTRSSTGPDGAHDAPVLVTSSRAYRCEPPSATRSQKRLRAPPRGKSTPR